jgi:YHS domain-containing protein
VDAAVTAKHTVVIGFCCEKCQAKFKEAPAGEKFAAALKAAAGKPVNTLCPVSGEEIDADQTVVHEGKTVGFCCEKCAKKFSAAPADFAAKVKAERPANEKCPLSGEEVDVATVVAHTEEVGFCCEKCQAKFKENPAAVLNKEKE